MALFSVADRRESVSLLRYSFLSHVQIFSSEISFVCRLKYPYKCLSCFNLHQYFFTSTQSTQSLMLVSLLSSFLDAHSLSTSVYISSIVFLFSSPFVKALFLVHFKNGPEYFTKGTIQVFISLTRFLQYHLVSSSFLVLQKYSFFNFFKSPLIVLILPSSVFSRFSLLAWRVFLCQIPSLCPDCKFSLLLLGVQILFHFWPTV